MPGFDDFVDGFLSGAYDPHFAAAAAADFFHQGLQVQEEADVFAYVLAHFVEHEEEAEVSGFAVYVVFQLGDELLDAEGYVFAAIEPVPGGCFTHAQDSLQGLYDGIFGEYVGVPAIDPGNATDFFEDAAEFFCLSLFVDVLLQFHHFEVAAVESQVGVEYFRKYADHGGFFFFVDGLALGFDIEEECVCLAPGGGVDEVEGVRVVFEFFAESVYAADALYFFVFQEVGEHFQEVGFTTAEEAGNPYADVCGPFVEGVAVSLKEGGEVLLQVFGDDVFVQFLDQYVVGVLLYFDNAIDFAVDIVLEQVSDNHRSLLISH